MFYRLKSPSACGGIFRQAQSGSHLRGFAKSCDFEREGCVFLRGARAGLAALARLAQLTGLAALAGLLAGWLAGWPAQPAQPAQPDQPLAPPKKRAPLVQNRNFLRTRLGGLPDWTRPEIPAQAEDDFRR